MLNPTNTAATRWLAPALLITAIELISLAQTNTHINPIEWITLAAIISTLSIATLLACTKINQFFLAQLTTPSIRRLVEVVFTFGSLSLWCWIMAFGAPFMFGFALVPRAAWSAGVPIEHTVYIILSMLISAALTFAQEKNTRARTIITYIQPPLWALLTFLIVFNFVEFMHFHLLTVFMLFITLSRLPAPSLPIRTTCTTLLIGLIALVTLPFLPNNTSQLLAHRTRLWFHAQYATAQFSSRSTIDLSTCIDKTPESAPKSQLPTVRGVVVILIDTLRADRIGMIYKNTELMPNLNAFAAQSLNFTSSFALFPATADSVGAMASASYNAQNEPLLDQLLAANHVRFDFLPSYPKMSDVFGPRINIIPLDIPDYDPRYDLSSPQITATALAHLNTLPADEPFVFVVHYFDPHGFYVKNDLIYFGPTFQDHYNAEVHYTDQALGTLFAQIPDDLAVLILSDHGDELGDHGHYHHGNQVYDESSRLVTLLKYPGAQPATHTLPVSSVDIAPTIFALLGIEQPARIDGIPLTTSPPDRTVLLRGSHRHGLVTKDHKIIWNDRSRTLEVYDRQKDPLESKNLAHLLPKNITTCDQLFTTLSSLQPS